MKSLFAKRAMALPSAFRERLEQMEHTRNQRLSLLQAEKELQSSKSQALASKLSNITAIEYRCLKLDRAIASQHMIISSLNSHIHRLNSNHNTNLQQLRVLKNEVEELEELEKEKDRYYSSESREMDEFKAQKEDFFVECQVQVEELKSHLNELKSRFSELQGNVNYSNNSEIAAAEMKKSELLSVKENLARNLASNYQLREQLRKQLQNILAGQAREKDYVSLLKTPGKNHKLTILGVNIMS